MDQVKSNNIVSPDKSFNNKRASLPRDLKTNPTDNSSSVVVISSPIDPNINPSQNVGLPVPSINNNIPPDTPTILSVVSQTVSHKPDGTSTIDVVLKVSDINGASEYDVRVAKSAGNL